MFAHFLEAISAGFFPCFVGFACCFGSVVIAQRLKQGYFDVLDFYLFYKHVEIQDLECRSY